MEEGAEELRSTWLAVGTTKEGWGLRQQHLGRSKWRGTKNFPAAAQREACWRRRKNDGQGCEVRMDS